MHSILEEDLELIIKSDIAWENYRNKTILITGATGLIGSLLVKTFVRFNRISQGNVLIIAVVRNGEKAKRILGEELKEAEVKVYVGDITEDIYIEEDIDYIFHTASVTASKIMVENPVETIEVSYQGTNNILKLARQKSVKGMVYVSSMEAYGISNPELEFVEEKDLGYIDLANVRSSYSEGKRICECLCTAYMSEYQVPVTIARLAQTFGAGILETDNRVYAQFAKSVIDEKDIILHTDGLSEGNYCYTRDVIRGLLILGYLGESGQAYNVVNSESHMQIREMAQLVAEKVSDGKIKVIYDIPDNPLKYGYAPPVKMHLSSRKINALGWKAEVGLEEAYKRMIADMKEGIQ
ncbi:NAD-dependent epimerase/dehydratase family protein [Claveliimonas bilis]|uniref:Nucleotide sugar dehydratase n=1 Tax=Claveliimonas bilis TaxID=3028070 RepID=A0ABM8I259_9FIRM|nr:NAD-dependent epimerase/dehydratase family protein [Claveliimonas bilis]BDZ77041.1 nucleotide sugar dehydratase [Claveliimonas bilis]